MTPMERTEHHFGPFWEKDLGHYLTAPSCPGPFVLLLTFEMPWGRNTVVTKLITDRRFFSGTIPGFRLKFALDTSILTALSEAIPQGKRRSDREGAV